MTSLSTRFLGHPRLMNPIFMGRITGCQPEWRSDYGGWRETGD